MRTKVSVIIPTYNSEKTIERAIKSVLSQHGIYLQFDIEILICDDCSTDNTISLCKNYSRVKIFRNNTNSGGPNWGRNKGITNATGKVICFLDHDDEWLPEKIKLQLKEINKGYEFVYSPSIKKLE
jgi:glycosyltransferase involved in cell wall biosynthesis